MKCLFAFIAAIIFPIICYATKPIQEILNYGHNPFYQPILINGVCVSHPIGPTSMDACDRKYECIKQVIASIPHPVKVFDIGANNGFYSIKIAQDFPDACCVMGDVTDRLTQICALNTDYSNLIYLKYAFNHENLVKLEKQEHFDVIIMLQLLHHMGDGWRQCFEVVRSLCDYLIIEVPPPNCRLNHYPYKAELFHFLESHPCSEVLGIFPREFVPCKLFLFRNNTHRSASKSFSKLKLDTFNQFGGSYPFREQLNQLIKDTNYCISN